MRIDGNKVEAAVSVACVSQPVDLWEPKMVATDENITITFGSQIGFNEARRSVKIGGVPVAESNYSYVENILTIAGALQAGQKVEISGVVYPVRFPSYSFTFTL